MRELTPDSDLECQHNWIEGCCKGIDYIECLSCKRVYFGVNNGDPLQTALNILSEAVRSEGKRSFAKQDWFHNAKTLLIQYSNDK